MKLEIGYVGSQGHRLLATHDINYSNPQTCLDILNIATANSPTSPVLAERDYCGQFAEDAAFTFRRERFCPCFALAVCPEHICDSCGHDVGPNGITLVGLASILVAAVRSVDRQWLSGQMGFRCLPVSLLRTRLPARPITHCKFRWRNGFRMDSNLRRLHFQ